MSDQVPILTETGSGDNIDAGEYQRQVISALSSIQTNLLNLKDFSKKMSNGQTEVVQTNKKMFEDLKKEDKKQGKKKMFKGPLKLNNIAKFDPGSAFIGKVVRQEAQKDRSSIATWIKALGLLGGGIGMIFSGLFDDGPFKGVKKIAGRLMAELGGGLLRQILKPFKGLMDNVVKFFDKWLIKPFKGFFDNILKTVGKKGGKLLGKIGGEGFQAAIKKATKFVTKGMGKFAKALKFVPGIGSIVSLGFAISRFKSGDMLGGFLELAAGIADLFPGIGTAISWGLDLFLAYRDLGGMKKGEGVIEGTPIQDIFGKLGSWVWGKMKDIGKWFVENTAIGNIVGFVQNLQEGNFMEAVKDFAYFSTPLGWVFAFLNNTPTGKKVKKKVAEGIGKVTDIAKAVGGVIGDLSVNVFNFIKDFLGDMISKAGRGISIGVNWISQNILQPVGRWIGNQWGNISGAIGDFWNNWIKPNIIDPLGSAISGIWSKVSEWAGNMWSNWIKPYIVTPIGEKLSSLWSIITDKLEDAWANFVKPYIVDPIGKYLSKAWKGISNIGENLWNWLKSTLFDPLKDLIGGAMASGRLTFSEWFNKLWGTGVKGEKVSGARETLSEKGFSDVQMLQLARQMGFDNIGKGLVAVQKQLVETSKRYGSTEAAREAMLNGDITKVQDAIIKPNGQVVMTSQDDTLIASKNPVYQADKGINDDIAQMNRYDDTAIQRQNERIIGLLQAIADKDMTQNNYNVAGGGSSASLNERRVREMMTQEAF